MTDSPQLEGGILATISKAEMGRAAVCMVMTDLILAGYKPIASEENFPFDIIAEFDGVLKKIQVKSTASKMMQRKGKTAFYNFFLKRDLQKYHNKHTDAFAMVMMDTKNIAYLSKRDFNGWCVALVDKNEEREGRRNSGASRRRFWEDMTLKRLAETI